MIEIIAIIILICSLFGMGIIVWRKLPLLAEAPEFLAKEKETPDLEIKKKIKELLPFKNFSYEIFLQKILSKIRILTLKTDHKTFSWLQKLRERMKKKKIDNDNYWEKIKKEIK